MTAEAAGWPPATETELDQLEERIDGWFDDARREHPVVEAVERGAPGERRWLVRLAGEDKDHITIWFTLQQRSLHFEVQVVPAPEENHAAFHEMFLRRNARTVGMAFAIGEEDAVYLVGRLAHAHVDPSTLDRVIGSAWTYVEQAFRPALHTGFASRMRGRT